MRIELCRCMELRKVPRTSSSFAAACVSMFLCPRFFLSCGGASKVGLSLCLSFFLFLSLVLSFCLVLSLSLSFSLVFALCFSVHLPCISPPRSTVLAANG
eukprot:COSAG05_NODE_107_length_18696_cov_209.227766_11_plen_100_part_00